MLTRDDLKKAIDEVVDHAGARLTIEYRVSNAVRSFEGRVEICNCNDDIFLKMITKHARQSAYTQTITVKEHARVGDILVDEDSALVFYIPDSGGERLMFIFERFPEGLVEKMTCELILR